MRFVVLGAGAIGGAVGGRLFQQGYRRHARRAGAPTADALRSGLVLESPEETVTLPDPGRHRPRPRCRGTRRRRRPVVLLAVKGQHTDHALAQLTPWPRRRRRWSACRTAWRTSDGCLRHFPDTYGMCVMCPATQLRPGVVQVHSAPVSGLLDLGRYPAGDR